DSLDPEKLLQCPYDKNHQIRACRFPYHLIKCRKNHPDVASKLATCPFNARHQVPRAEISHHISSCDDRSCIEQDLIFCIFSRDRVPPCHLPKCWDYRREPLPANNIVMEHKNNLASGMRVPKSLPYILPWKNNGNTQ
uniref:Gametocyte specific factor 1 n=1 Tax=Cebus imitator TaxID=2715852 RepID=A0A2K5RN38_CEBIM